MLQKFAGPLVGAPVWPNMLNMPTSATEHAKYLGQRQFTSKVIVHIHIHRRMMDWMLYLLGKNFSKIHFEESCWQKDRVLDGMKRRND